MAVSRKKSHGSSAKSANISAKIFSKAWFPPSKNKHTPETVGLVLAYPKEDLTTSELRINPKPGLWKFNKFLGFVTTQADQKQKKSQTEQLMGFPELVVGFFTLRPPYAFGPYDPQSMFSDVPSNKHIPRFFKILPKTIVMIPKKLMIS